MRISDWSSDVCSSDLRRAGIEHAFALAEGRRRVRIAHLLRRRRTGNRGKRHRGEPKTKCPRPHSHIVHLEKFPPIDWLLFGRSVPTQPRSEEPRARTEGVSTD